MPWRDGLITIFKEKSVRVSTDITCYRGAGHLDCTSNDASGATGKPLEGRDLEHQQSHDYDDSKCAEHEDSKREKGTKTLSKSSL